MYVYSTFKYNKEKRKKYERRISGKKKCKILLDRQLGTITCLWAQPIDDQKIFPFSQQNHYLKMKNKHKHLKGQDQKGNFNQI